ncbi:DUF4112 domain-containing protein [Opitutia bacterium ISCC 51]|mgnify:CR=1 FL=1|nr:DUF4112 domain-containing protein [Opitutae bacterium ISCC 51]QXD27690.1 DUF4112 domain-containing protein [Opitutae bacterium ISCC 52]
MHALIFRKNGLQYLKSIICAAIFDDTLTLLPQLYFLYEAFRAKVDLPTIFKMAINFLIDWAVVSIPVFGDVFDVAFKSNLRNAKLLAEAIRKKQAINISSE